MADTAQVQHVVVTFPVDRDDRAIFDQVVGPVASLDYLSGLSDAERLPAVRRADAVVVWNWQRELLPEERRALGGVGLIQLISAGADQIPFHEIQVGVTVASNAGAFAEPMAEHVVAMTLALAKRLVPNHLRLAQGEWNQFSMNRQLDGGVCGILGFGGIGMATARRMRAMGMRIHAINTSGRTDEPVEFIGTLADLDGVLGVADVLVIALPLTNATRDLIGRPQLQRMKPDAILVNVARGAILQEAELFEHLTGNPQFSVGIDAWWTEPFSAGEFRVDHAFFDLPNLVGSPHNSALVPGILSHAARTATENVARFLRGEPVRGVVRRDDYIGQP